MSSATHRFRLSSNSGQSIKPIIFFKRMKILGVYKQSKAVFNICVGGLMLIRGGSPWRFKFLVKIPRGIVAMAEF